MIAAVFEYYTVPGYRCYCSSIRIDLHAVHGYMPTWVVYGTGAFIDCTPATELLAHATQHAAALSHQQLPPTRNRVGGLSGDGRSVELELEPIQLAAEDAVLSHTG